MNVLILSGGGFQGQTVLKELNVISGIQTFVADIYQENVTKYFTANYLLFPKITDPAFAAHLKKVVAENSIDVIIPSTALELSTLAEIKSQLTCRTAVSSSAIIDIFSSKKKSYTFLKENDFKILPLYSAEEITEQVLPVITKENFGFGSRGVEIIRSIAEWEQWKKQHSNSADFIFQKYLENVEEFSADFAIDFYGAVSALNVRSRLRQSGGFATVMSFVQDKLISKPIELFAKKIASTGACGLFNVQVLKHNDQIYFSDINPRMGTSAVVGETHGNNLCAFLLASLGVQHEYLIDERPKKTIRYLSEKFILQKPHAVQAVIFDLDDTLFPQKKWILAKLELLRERLDLDIPKSGWLSEGLHQLENGHRADLLDRLIEVFQIPVERKQELIEEYRKIIPGATIYPDVIPVLNALRKKGIKTGLLTDNPPESQRQKIHASGLATHFDQIVFTREAGGEKPYIGAFDEIKKKLNVTGENSIYIGDHLYKDVLGAYLAGYKMIFHIQREGGFFNFDEKEFRRLHPAIEFSRLTDLFDLIGYING